MSAASSTIDETGRLKTCMGAEHIGDLRTQIFMGRKAEGRW